MLNSRVLLARAQPRLPLRLHAVPEQGPEKGTQSGPPAWKRYQRIREGRLGRQAEATLETVWERTQWPSDDTIASMWDLHRVRRDVVIDWFSNKRRQVRGGGGGKRSGGSTSGGGGGAARKHAASAPGVDWDDEWETAATTPQSPSQQSSHKSHSHSQDLHSKGHDAHSHGDDFGGDDDGGGDD